jgi:hypothetical protein
MAKSTPPNLRSSKYLLDDDSQELLLADNGYQIMMEWERPYMAALVEKLRPFGEVLEVGFGLGYSATEIQKHDIKSHTIIECDDAVISRAEAWAEKQEKPVQIIRARWQDKLESLGTFDSIFFDDSPEPNTSQVDRSLEIASFLLTSVLRNSRVGTRIVWYLDRAATVLVPPYVRYEVTAYDIDVPANAKYVTTQTDSMYLPLMEILDTKRSNQPYLGMDANYEVHKFYV